MPMPPPLPAMRSRWFHIFTSRGIGVLHLGEFDLQLGLVASGPGGEDVEDQLGAIQDLDAFPRLESMAC